MGKFHYFKVGLSLVLTFVGSKMILASIYEIPIVVSLGVIVTVLVGAIAASLLRPPSEGPEMRSSCSQR